MANAKISELPAAGTLTGNETVPVVQDTTTKRATLANVGAVTHAHSGTYVPTVPAAKITTVSDGVFTSMGPGAGEYFKLAVMQDAAAPTVSAANDGGYGAAFFGCQRFSGTVPNTPNGYFFGDAVLAMLQLISLNTTNVATFAGVSAIETDVRIAGTGTNITNVNGDYVVPILAGELPPAGTIGKWRGVFADTAQGHAHASGLTVTSAISGFFGRPFRNNNNVTVTNQTSLYAEEGQVFEVDPSNGTQGWFGLRNREDGLSFWQRVVDQKWQLLKNDGSLAMVEVDSNGHLSAYAGIRPTGTAGHTSGSLLTSGSAAPNDAVGSNGDYYFRSGTPGTPDQRVYIKSGGVWVPLDPNPDGLTTGEETMPRGETFSSPTMSTGVLRLAYFTAQKTETVTQVRICSAATAAGATPTLLRVGIWTSDDTGALLSQVGATANDTTLLAAANTAYTKALSASFAKQAGQRYAVGLLVVTGATAPTVPGSAMTLPATEVAMGPKLAGAISALADLPATATAGTVGASTNRPYYVVLP